MLTDEQKELVEENVRLAYYVAHKSIVPMENEEKVSLALLGLTKAAKKYNPDAGTKFSTFAGYVMQNEIRMAWRKEKKYVGQISLDEPANGNEDGYLLKEVVSDKKQDLEDLETRITYVQLIHQAEIVLRGKEKECFFLIVRNPGKTQQEYAAEMEVSQSYFSRILKTAREKVKRGGL